MSEDIKKKITYLLYAILAILFCFLVFTFLTTKPPVEPDVNLERQANISSLASSYIDTEDPNERTMKCTYVKENDNYRIEGENVYTYIGDTPKTKHEIVRTFSEDTDLLQKMIDSFNDKASNEYDMVGGVSTDSTYNLDGDGEKAVYFDTFIHYDSIDMEKYKTINPNLENIMNENKFSMLKIQTANEADGFTCEMVVKEPQVLEES